MSMAEAVQTTAKSSSSTTSGLLLQRKCACGGSASFSGECEQCKSKKLLGKPLRRKLAINEPGDEYEREADRIAEQVMRMPELGKRNGASTTATAPLEQRKASANNAGISTAPPIVHEVLSAPGQPLDTETQAFFEPRFGHDFSQIRIHSDTTAAASARAINALAYSAGNHVVFGSNQYHPKTTQGRMLLAHEFAHVGQQALSNTFSLQRKLDPRSPSLWQDVSIYGKYAPETFENLLAEVPEARQEEAAVTRVEFQGTENLEQALLNLVKLTALDLMAQYRHRVMSDRDAVQTQGSALGVTGGISSAARIILDLDRQKRDLERSRAQLALLESETNTGGASPFTEEWARRVGDYTRDLRNRSITAALREFAVWVTENEAELTEGNRYRGTALLLALEKIRAQQIANTSMRIREQYAKYPFLAQYYLRDAVTESVESFVGDPTGDIVEIAKTGTGYVESIVDWLDPTGLAQKARVTTQSTIVSLAGPTVEDFSTASFTNDAAYLKEVLNAYSTLIANIETAIGKIGAEQINAFVLPEAVAAVRKGLTTIELQRKLDQLKDQKELTELAISLGLTVLQAGLALLPVVGPGLAFAAGLYASAKDLKSTMDMRALGQAADNPEGEILGAQTPGGMEVALAFGNLALSSLDVFDAFELEIQKMDIDVPELPGSVEAKTRVREHPIDAPVAETKATAAVPGSVLPSEMGLDPEGSPENSL